MATATFRSQTGKTFPVEAYEPGDTLLEVKEKFSTQSGIDVEHMAQVIQQGRPLSDENPASGMLDLIVRPCLIEYSFLTKPDMKTYKPAADGYRGTYMNPKMNNYTHTRRLDERSAKPSKERNVY